MSDFRPFLARPGLPGAFGAIMDETARAAESFCAVIESLPDERFLRERPGADPDTGSIRAICAHAIGAAHRYADYIRKARGLPYVERFELQPDRVAAPASVRPLLIEALRYTEEALEGLYDAPDEEAAAITFPVRWGPTYDPEMILEHGIVHLLRHRRQVERWGA
jgi:uncharacterized damage-inducible protein DinB